MRDSPIIVVCAIGFLVMGFVSIFSSIEPGTSISDFVNVILSWYVPFLAVAYGIRSEEDALRLVRALCWCAIFIACAGFVEFVLQKNIFLAIMPGWLTASLAANNPAFAYMLTFVQMRDGHYRAASVYTISLSFGEFMAMMVPLACFFLVHSTKLRDTLFGVVTVGACLIGIFSAGSRGAYQSAIVATVAFLVLWGARKAVLDRRSLAPALIALLGIGSAVVLTGLIAFVPAIHNRVMGGGEGEMSNLARWEQWDLAKPKIAANPITGHGLGLGPYIVGYHLEFGRGTLDSYVISTLVETGVPGFVLFFGTILAAAARGMRQYVFSPSRSSLIAGAAGCSVVAFGFYRIALSQQENMTLFFAMAGLIMALAHSAKLDRIHAGYAGPGVDQGKGRATRQMSRAPPGAPAPTNVFP